MSFGTITAGQLVLTGSQDYIPRRSASQTLLGFQAKSSGASDSLVTQWTSSGATIQDQLNGTRVSYGSSGARAVLQSREYAWCPAGRGNTCALTILMQDGLASSASQAGVRIRVGVFDDGNDKSASTDSDLGGNGYFLEFDSGTFYAVERISSGSSYSDTRVSQSLWNMSTVSSLDVSKVMTVIIDREGSSHGVGTRIGFASDAGVTYAHSFDSNSATSSRTKRLPVRFEVQNYSVSTLVNTPKTRFFDASILSSVGASESDMGRHLAYTSIEEVALTSTYTPVMSLSTDGAHERQRICVDRICCVNTGDCALQYEIRMNGTLSGDSWTSQDGIARVDVAATDCSGGVLIASGFCSSASDFARDISRGVVSWTIAGTPGALTVLAKSVRTDVVATAHWGVSWTETA